MSKEIVTVTNVINDKVEIKFTKQTMCSCCRLSSLCNQGQETLLVDNNGLSLKAGDKVEIFIDERKSLLANTVIFFIPLIIFISVLILFQRYGELKSFLLALGVLFVYYMITRLILSKYGNKFDLKILGKVTYE
ncbi:MAG: SoxR reducing system RseC family protein [Candidatus Omnitrophica bacterium]|jgi:positive regulator of sigma E activity|nr:SoxR reducing system RseC family protein [Candidatus Omnitrophota bacterium]